ncbi:hypothetical protein B2J88_49915 [Rhodococcus sp. SRB_17]|uniref:hypothetical protein n=1 Tax=Rhodococcus sp. OK302 TaxID=1882769 RepID=UPI0011404400|nr:hypothetical protein [Rhodococcus sp. OK302]NMM92271.1 hypothetical protein [Rhodococcus sp. SRB_17]
MRSADRKTLLTELDSELGGALDDGRSVTAVVGEDAPATLRAWADEREMSGRALRLGLIIPVALIAVAIGLSGTLYGLTIAFTNVYSGSPGMLVLPLYLTSGVLAYLCAVMSVWATLRLSGDPRISATVKRLAALLPIGALLAVGAGSGIAWLQGFTTTPLTFAVVIAVVVLVLALTVSAARHLALEHHYSS